MTLRTGNRLINASNVERRPRTGFTLIELILVMAILVVVLSVSAPSLSRFFRATAMSWARAECQYGGPW